MSAVSGPDRVRSGVHEHREQLPVRLPFAAAHLFGFLAARAVPGVEEGDDAGFRRTLLLPGGPAIVEATYAGGPSVDGRVVVSDRRDVRRAVDALRRTLDLDADPEQIDARLSGDPAMAPLVARLPGMRSPGHADGVELAVRAILGQQVSVQGARTLAGRLTAAYGIPLPEPSGGLTHLFPTAEAIARVDPGDLPMPGARKRALLGLARALADAEIVLHPDVDREGVSARLLALPGIGPWTVTYIRMRALGDQDAFLGGDLGIRKALAGLMLDADPRGASRVAERWSPFRSYAMHHLWAAPAPE